MVERGSFLITEGGVLAASFILLSFFPSCLVYSTVSHYYVMHEFPGLSFGSLLFVFTSFFFVSISSSSFFLFLFLRLPPLLLLFSSSSSSSFSSFSSFSSSLFSSVPPPPCLVLLCPPARTLVSHHAGECFVYGIVACPFSVVVTIHPWGGMGCLMVGVVCDCCREPQVMKLQLKDVYASFGQRPAASAIQSVPALFVPLRSVLSFVSLVFLGHILSFLVTLFICFCCCLLISCLSSLSFDRFLPAPPLPPIPLLSTDFIGLLLLLRCQLYLWGSTYLGEIFAFVTGFFVSFFIQP